MRLLSDDKDFLGILDQHKRIIFKICNSYCRNPESRKDLVQEVVIQLWKSYPKYDPQYKISTWIYRIALNVAISFYRKEKKHLHATSITESAMNVAMEGDSFDTERDILWLRRFIDQLDELHRALMILYLDGNSYKDIADVLGITETNVATKINRIKQKLKREFENIK